MRLVSAGSSQSTRVFRALRLCAVSRSPHLTTTVLRRHAAVAALSLIRRGARFVPVGHGAWRVGTREGLSFLVDERTLTSDLHLISRLFDDDAHAFLGVEGRVVIDVGANVGDSAIAFAHRRARAVYAFEPFAATYERARRNIALNGLGERITLFPVGLGRGRERRQARYEPSVSAGLTTSLEFGMAMGEPAAGASETVEVVSLNTALEWCDLPVGERVVLKMDCEGSEFEVFSDPHTYDRALKRIDRAVIEYHWHAPDPIIAVLSAAGFEVSIRETSYPGIGLLLAARSETGTHASPWTPQVESARGGRGGRPRPPSPWMPKNHRRARNRQGAPLRRRADEDVRPYETRMSEVVGKVGFNESLPASVARAGLAPQGRRLRPDGTVLLHALRRRELAIAMQDFPDHHFATGLELGAGDGFQSSLLTRWVEQLVSTDFDISRLPQPAPAGIEYRQLDARKLEATFEPGRFDLVYSSSMLHCLPELPAVLRGIHSVLADDGVTIHVVPSACWALLHVALYVPNLVLRSAEVLLWAGGIRALPRMVRRVLQPGVPAGRSAEGVNPHFWREPDGRGRLQRLLIPEPGGIARTNREEIGRFRLRTWLRTFAEAGFSVEAVYKGPVATGYGFGVEPLRAALERLGCASSYMVVAKKAPRP